MMTHLPVLGRSVRCILSEAVAVPTDTEVPLACLPWPTCGELGIQHFSPTICFPLWSIVRSSLWKNRSPEGQRERDHGPFFFL